MQYVLLGGKTIRLWINVELFVLFFKPYSLAQCSVMWLLVLEVTGSIYEVSQQDHSSLEVSLSHSGFPFRKSHRKYS